MEKQKTTIITYDKARSAEDLRQILDLQQANLPKHISDQEQKEQGFVTVEHNFELLSSMYHVAPQIIARHEGQVIGYALVMLKSFADQIPVLIPMFEMLATLSYQNKAIDDYAYFVMGQVCVGKAYRGQGVFDGLYQAQKEHLSNTYDFVVTEVATRNTRSLRAHERLGFKTIHTFKEPQEEWAIVLWDWT
ncbi:MAG: GNAT family N-acetyltransferase [Saprospiraceae bacterium]